MILSRLVILVSLGISQTSFAWTSWIGVLEDWPIQPQSNTANKNPDAKAPDSQSKTDTKSAQEYEPRVRPLFLRIDKKPWQAAPKKTDKDSAVQLPKALSWDVCFTGRSEGQLTAMLTSSEQSSMTPPYMLRAEDRAPWRTRRSVDYGGWMEIPVYKPILLKSSLNSSCSDPQKWRQGGAEKARPHLKNIIAELRKRMASPQDGDEVYSFEDKDVRIQKTWSSSQGGTIVALQTRPKSRHTETFHVLKNGDIKFLGSDMMLIDAGDFDGDGATEMLFKRHTDKKDIYDLFSDSNRLAESVWE